MMRRPTLTLLSALSVAGLVLTACSSVPTAEAAPPVPQPNASCPGDFDGALTRLADRTLLVCRDGTWATDTDVYPSSDRWVSYGPALTVYGQGRRNPEFLAGNWIATPQGGDTRCAADKVEVVAAGELGAPAAATGEPGSPLEFAVPTKLFTAALTGFCLWERDA